MTNHAKQEAEIASAIEWCSLLRGHQTGRLLARLRDQVAEFAQREQAAKAEAWDEGHRFTGYEPARGENPYRSA